jgi:hypothetical protein
MKLYDVPYLVINFEDLSEEDYDFLSKIHKNNIDLKELHEEAQDFFFLEGFAEALASELLDPSDDLVKALFNRMQGKRITDQIKVKIKSLINSTSIQTVLPKLMEEESKNGNIIITTAEELKIYHSVKTIILNSIKKVDASRISFRDQKNSFNILVDDNQKKLIAKITSSRNKYLIELNGNKYDANDIENIVAQKKILIDIATQHLS